MGSTYIPTSYPFDIPHAFAEHVTSAPRRHRRSAQVVRRQPTMAQGRSLEILGHAVEYLVDSQMHRAGADSAKSDTAAQEILMRLNREVFGECREILPLAQQLRRWASRMLPGRLA